MTEIEKEQIKGITTYPWDILEGRIISCKYIKLACERFFKFLDRDDMYFDIDEVMRVINFTHHLKHFLGKYNSKPFELEPWQKFIYMNVYGFKWKESGLRVTRTFILSVGRKNGKALSIDTEIPTPNGFTRMGELKVGDYVIGSDGKPTQIIAATDVMYDRPCYKVDFEDGASVIADANHEWVVKTKKNGVMKLTTKDFAQNYVHKRADGKGSEYRYRVPMSKAIEYSEKELPIDPYLLGIWLADGTSSKPDITFNMEDTEIISRVTSILGETNVIHKKYGRNKAKTYSYYGERKNGFNFYQSLKKLNLIHNKHIPKIYLESSIEQRMELLKGLMDGDGYVSKNGECEISQVSHKLAYQISELLSSVGIKNTKHIKTPKIDGKECNDVVRITFYTDKENPCFSLSRKFNRLKDKLNKRMEWKSITNVEKVDSVPVRCIQVDNQSHCYCFGREYTVTHNSSLLSAMALWALLEEAAASCVVAANSANQAKLLFNMASSYLKSIDAKGKLFRRYRDRILYDKTTSEIKVVASDASRLDGLNCSFFVEDETAAAPDSSIWDILESSQGSREQPLACSCTTRGFQLSGFYHEFEASAISVLNGVLEDDTLFTLIYTLDEEDDYQDDEVWIKSNPNLGISISKDFINQQITKCKNNPVQELSIKTKIFNMWVSSSDSWIPLQYIYDSMQKVNLNDYEDMYCYLSFDLASVCDLTCMCMMIPWNDKFVFKVWYYLPSDSIENNPNAEKYKRWIQQGHLIMTQGNVTDYDYVINEIVRVNNVCPITKISYDQWNATDMAIRLTEMSMPLQPYSQSIQSMNLPSKTLERFILSGRVIIDNNPITAWCFENCVTKYDYNDNVKIIKNSVMQKIDGAVSMIMNLGGYMSDNHYDNEISGTQVQN